MPKKYIIALDQGTSSSRAVLFNDKREIVDIVQEELTQIHPETGWVEQDPKVIWDDQHGVLIQLIENNEISGKDIAAIGITNQRETTVIWDKETGNPIYNAIVWQDTRTKDICEDLKEKGLEDYVKENTGVVIDSYFSASKIKWILDNVKGARKRAENGELAFGTIDSWLIWNLTKGKSHLTDYSNASRTLLYNIKKLDWDKKLLSEFGVPFSMLPEVKPSAYAFGNFDYKGTEIPIAGVLGDQQAALFGQACFEEGDVKNTYGTGCFMLMNTGEKIKKSRHGLITTIAWGLNGKINYALEGSIFYAGAAIKWLRDDLGLLDIAEESEYYANKTDCETYLVPAWSGLGAPYWDPNARSVMINFPVGEGKAAIIKATLDSIAYQTRDVLEAMKKDSKIEIKTLRVDGGGF